MRSKLQGSGVALIMVIALLAGCGGGELRIPRDWCDADSDCAKGFKCIKKTSYDNGGTCEDPSKPQCVGDDGGTGDDAGDASTTTDAGSDAGDAGSTECVFDAGQPVELAIENVNVTTVTASVIEFKCNTTVVAQCRISLDGAAGPVDSQALWNHVFIVSGITPGEHSYNITCQTSTDLKVFTSVFTTSPEPDRTNPVITTGSRDLTATTVTIDFDPSEPLQSAQVFYGAGAGLSETQLSSGPNWTTGTSDTFSLSGLNQDATYSYQVRCVDVRGNPGKSTIKTIKTLKLVPPDLTPPFIASREQDMAATSATVSARSNKELTNVSLEYRVENAPPSTITLSGTFNAGSLITASISGLTPNTAYSFLMKGTGPNGVVGTDSDTFTTLQVFDTTRPTVAISTAFPATVSSNTLSFNGTASDDVGVTSVTCTKITKNASSCITPTGMTSWTVGATLAVGTTVFAIKAMDAAGNPSEPAYMEATYTPPPGVDATPPTIVDVSLVGIVGTTSTTFKIIADESMRSFQVNYGTSPTNLAAGPTAGAGTFATITLAGLDPGKLYYFQAVGKDVAGNVSSPNSNGKDQGKFMTWAVATGKYEFVCDWAAPSGCTAKVYYTFGSGSYVQAVRVSLTGIQICPPVQPVNGNPVEQVWCTTSASDGADICRVFRPDGSPFLNGNGLPVLPRSGSFATIDLGVLTAGAANCAAFKY